MADKRLIDANALEEVLHERYMEMRKECSAYDHYVCGFSDAIDYVEDAPTIDAVEVVRCRECKYSVCIFKAQFVGCDMWKQSTPKDGFCHMGEKLYATDNNVGNKDGGAD